MFATNLATLTILTLGGRFVIQGAMTLGDFSAFNNYLFILIFPVIIIGFMSNIMALAGAAFQRISLVLDAPEHKESGTIKAALRGDIAIRDVVLSLGEKLVLKDVSFEAKAGTKTAVIGPTAAGKTQLLYLLTGLLKPDAGRVEFDGRSIEEYESTALHEQIGFVFQDSIIFSLTLRENIAFSKTVTDQDLEKAISTAELKDFIDALPDKLNTVVSERGSQPLRRPEATHHAGSSAGAQSAGPAARRFHVARRFHHRAQDSRERRAQLSGNHAAVGHAEDCSGRGLRSDPPPDGGRSAGLWNPPSVAGRVSRVRPNL